MPTTVEPATWPSWLSEAFAERGFEALTPIQNAVLAIEEPKRDLRLLSATGSGKTVAVAIALGQTLAPPVESTSNVCLSDDEEASSATTDAASKQAAPPARQVQQPTPAANNKHDLAPGTAMPRALVLAPTRELAAQLRRELAWLYRSLNVEVALVVGGGAYRTELRALARRPQVLVATPGRLLDHMNRGSVRLDATEVVAMDEADRLLELGFKDDLDAILTTCPTERRTLLISATFSHAVEQLARTHQHNPLRVEGTPTNQPHADIEHVVHVIHGRDQLAAITNLLLLGGDDRCLLFVTTRAQVTDLVQALQDKQFQVGGLSGDMGQTERTRTLQAFRRGQVRILVATDVAARGIDVQDVRLVIHAYPPRDAEGLIHRSGRTGRAGQQGRSVQLVTASDTARLQRLFRSAGLNAKVEPVPNAAAIRTAQNARLLSRLDASSETEETDRALAQDLLERYEATELIARLLGEVQQGLPCTPEVVQPVTSGKRHAGPRPGGSLQDGQFPGAPQTFELSYGKRRGATPERVMAMVCRRGRIQRRDVGNIEIGDRVTRVEISADKAEHFAHAAGRRDHRDRDIHIRPAQGSVGSGSNSSGAPQGDRPPTRKPNQQRRPPFRRSQNGFSSAKAL